MPAVIGDARRGIKALKREADDRADLYAAVNEIERLGGLDRAIATIEDHTRQAESALAEAQERQRAAQAAFDREIADLHTQRQQADHARSEAVQQANEAAKMARDQATSLVADAQVQADQLLEDARAKARAMELDAGDRVADLDAKRRDLSARIVELEDEHVKAQERKAAIEAELAKLKARLG